MAKKFLNGIDVNSQKITSLANGTASGDAVNFTQLQTKLSTSGAAIITVSTTAPSSPATGDLWVDTN